MATAAEILADALMGTSPDRRRGLLCDLLAHTTAALVIIIGRPEAAEQLYRAADALVTSSKD